MDMFRITYSINVYCKARRRGLVVRVKTHDQEIVGSNPDPAVETIYHAPLKLDQKAWKHNQEDILTKNNFGVRIGFG